jgi:outer membrane protein OmpA-like peptidoglycan-associated protein
VNNNNLYYASNGLPGYGGYDIYVSEKKDNKWTAPVNLGAPLNSFEDQYSFSVASDGVKAYFSKEEGKNRSRLYMTTIPDVWRVAKKGNVVKGVVRNSKTQKPVKASVELYDLKTNNLISVIESDSLNGAYLIVVPGKSEYALHVAKAGYLFSSLHFNYEEKDQDQPLVINLDLQPISKNAVTVLNNIFFDVNQYELKERSATELDEVVLFLQNNPTVKVEISGHTDNSGNEQYNQQLSLKRAQSVSDYLVKKGIAAVRLQQKGYGSQKPVKDNVTEEGRQANRRIEFRISE